MGDVLDDDLAVALAPEGDLAGQHLEQDDPQRIDIGAVIDLHLPLALFGGHVVRRAHHGTGARLVRHLLLGLGQLGQPEVQDLDEVRIATPGDQENVFRLEIAVDDAVVVRCAEGVSDLRGDGEGSPLGKDDLSLQAVCQRLTLEVLHDEVEVAGGGVSEIADVHDVFVADLVDGLGLHHEARNHLWIARQFRMDRLHGDLLADDGMLAQIHHAHAAFAELGCQLVVADHLTDVDHVRSASRDGQCHNPGSKSSAYPFYAGARRAPDLKEAFQTWPKGVVPACEPWAVSKCRNTSLMSSMTQQKSFRLI